MGPRPTASTLTIGDPADLVITQHAGACLIMDVSLRIRTVWYERDEFLFSPVSDGSRAPNPATDHHRWVPSTTCATPVELILIRVAAAGSSSGRGSHSTDMTLLHILTPTPRADLPTACRACFFVPSSPVTHIATARTHRPGVVGLSAAEAGLAAGAGRFFALLEFAIIIFFA